MIVIFQHPVRSTGFSKIFCRTLEAHLTDDHRALRFDVDKFHCHMQLILSWAGYIRVRGRQIRVVSDDILIICRAHMKEHYDDERIT